MEILKSSRIQNHLHNVLDGEEALYFLKKKGKYSGVPRPDFILLDLRRIPVAVLSSSGAKLILREPI